MKLHVDSRQLTMARNWIELSELRKSSEPEYLFHSLDFVDFFSQEFPIGQKRQLPSPKNITNEYQKTRAAIHHILNKENKRHSPANVQKCSIAVK